MSENRTSGNRHGFSENDFVIDNREGTNAFVQDLLRSHFTTLPELSKVVGLLSSKIQVLAPTKFQRFG